MGPIRFTPSARRVPLAGLPIQVVIVGAIADNNGHYSFAAALIC